MLHGLSVPAGGDLRPDTESAAVDVIAWAARHQSTVELLGHGSKRAFGHPVAADHRLDLSALTGITAYIPSELVITARAGTPLAEIRATLAEQGQHLACEPLCLSRLYAPSPDGVPADEGTVGGLVNANLSGPRRFAAGAVRDHLLGVRGINGQGRPFKAGGQVVKNVTGFDLCKLLAGSWGTLAALTEISLKVLPIAEKTRTLLLHGLDEATAVAAMTAALSSPWEVSGAVHLPAALAAASQVERVARGGGSVTALRVEGPPPSAAARCQALQALCAPWHSGEALHTHDSHVFWEEMRTSALLAARAPVVVWQLSLPPSNAATLALSLCQRLNADVVLDWGGGLLRVALGAESLPADGGAAEVRGLLAAQGCGGHATLVLGAQSLRRAVPVFQPQPAPLAALLRRVKDTLDPGGVFSPRRMTLS